MRRVVYSVASSLDGYIAGPAGEYDWIPMEKSMDWKAFMGRFDTVLMGRKTYEIALAQGGGPSSPAKKTYVFSRTLKSADHPKVTIVAEGARKVIEDLRAADGKDIWLMGGGVLFASVLMEGLVDVVEVGLVPILLGEGLPLLPRTSLRTRLALGTTQAYPSGIIRLAYDVVPGSTPKASRRKRQA